MVPPSSGAGTGRRRVGGRALCERFRFGGVGRIASASKLVCVRGRPLWGPDQHKMTDASGEAGRGGGSIYGDGSWRSAQVRLRTRPTFQSVGGWLVSYLVGFGFRLLVTVECRRLRLRLKAELLRGGPPGVQPPDSSGARKTAHSAARRARPEGRVKSTASCLATATMAFFLAPPVACAPRARRPSRFCTGG